MLLMAEMIFHLTFEHGLKNGAKSASGRYVFRALDVVVVEDLLSNLLALNGVVGGVLHFAILLPSLSLLPQYGHKVDSYNTDLHKLFYTPHYVLLSIDFIQKHEDMTGLNSMNSYIYRQQSIKAIYWR